MDKVREWMNVGVYELKVAEWMSREKLSEKYVI